MAARPHSRPWHTRLQDRGTQLWPLQLRKGCEHRSISWSTGSRAIHIATSARQEAAITELSKDVRATFDKLFDHISGAGAVVQQQYAAAVDPSVPSDDGTYGEALAAFERQSVLFSMILDAVDGWYGPMMDCSVP